MNRMVAVVALIVGTSGCASFAQQREADASFRRGVSAHLRGDDATAEREYRVVVATGVEWSAVYNNLAVLAARRHDYREARKLLARAIELDDKDIVALTNYGVISFWLDDLGEAERALTDARSVRFRAACQIPSMGRVNWESDECIRTTEALDQIAARYLARIAHAEQGAHLARERLVADLQLQRM